MGTTTQALAEYLATFTQAWPQPPQPWDYSYPVHAAPLASQHTASDVAGWLLADAGFRALKLGNWLSTPDGQLVTDAIEMLAPAPYAQDAQLLAEALQLAARQQQADARTKIAAAIAIGGAVIAIGASGGASSK